MHNSTINLQKGNIFNNHNRHLLRVNYIAKDYENSYMFNKAANEVYYIKGEISHASEDYIPVENEEDFE